MRKILYIAITLSFIALMVLVIPIFCSVPAKLNLLNTIPSAPAPYDDLPQHPVAPNALKNMFGINAYEWNFLQNPYNLNDPLHIYEPKMNLIKTFSGVRHYLDWEKIEPAEDSFTFNPARSGGWNYDAIYERCKQDNIEVLVCLKNCPPWIYKTYPAGMQGGENVPAPFGLNREDPASYIAQAKAGFQVAARYGSNKNINHALVTVDGKPRWTADPVNEVKIGMGVIKYIECDNERDKWWRGDAAKQTGREYAANLSAFYDGNKGKLGKNVGVKTADPNMQVVMCGLAAADTKFVQDMIDWCKQHRGYKPDGSINLCFDVINYHIYPNDNRQHANKQSTRGVAPELTEAGQVANNFVNLANSLRQHPEVWITESGYDINAQSPQRAMAVAGKTALETQGDWILRTALLYNRHGIKRTFFYQLFDDNTSAVQYSTSGFADDKTLARRPAADYILQTTNLVGNYQYKATINQYPLVDVYTLGNKTMYVLMIPDEKGRTGNYTLNLGSAKSIIVHSLNIGANVMTATKEPTVNGKFNMLASETPIFVEAAN
ncbi:hypothetical protein BDD43_5743 [Mucilaginibacter gracilis]|uniref:Glycoside hydrolase family 42 N-terminal domain-containing protein n=1 Tax=Mucilaginibacter gracilis TaxID=423350 RepID=A0A495JAU0_9SPHI|nr:hypothetical protein [Mucilaginibacter gracilis]RKR85472.1 hypothetical protein BDD43_5743 [Mucilaginibacter gracilis]